LNIKKLLQKNSLLKYFLNYFTGRILAKGVVFISIPIFSRILNPTEFGVNHEGSMLTAKWLVDEAKDRVAHPVKFQSYKAETLAAKHSTAYWDITKEPTESQFELFKKRDSFGKIILV
tara:strand:+ start:2163 stop:2516 length:354 start_codon:yes stop_codon:yes gene_type:complete